jgi:hypothetical protein
MEMIKRLLKSQAFLLPILITLIFVIELDEYLAVLAGFFLSLVFVISSTIIVDKFWNSDEPTFFKAFILSIPLRFFFVLTVFAVLLLVTKIDEIFFTVSFIISYLYHSITETIFINKILKKGSSNT